MTVQPDQPGKQTAADHAERRQRVLIEAGRVLTESLDYEVTLKNVAKLLVPALADWCVIDLVHAERLEPVMALNMPRRERTRPSEYCRW